MKRYVLNAVLIGMISLFSCVKKEQIAPDLGASSATVSFVDPFAVSNASPNFTNNEKIYFTATFAAQTSWVITVEGNNSKAIKTFEGFGTSISVTNALWDGTANIIPSFRVEAVTATLSFPYSKTAAVSLPISILGTKNLNYGNVLITDFYTTNKINQIYNGKFFQVYNTTWPSDWGPTTVANDVPLRNPDGNQYCTMGPQYAWSDDLSNKGHKSPYLDQMFISATSLGYPTYFPLTADPSQIYFNIMVYNNSKDPLNKYTWLQVTLHEDHPSIPDSIIAKTINIKPTWESGWKLLTYRYLDFIGSDSSHVLTNPHKIKDVNIVLLSDAPTTTLDLTYKDPTNALADPNIPKTTANFDHLIFTQYKPYQP